MAKLSKKFLAGQDGRDGLEAHEGLRTIQPQVGILFTSVEFLQAAESPSRLASLRIGLTL